MKKFLAIAFAFLLGLSLMGCDGGETGGNGGNSGNEDTYDVALADSLKGIGVDKKVYLTTVGQSDVDIVVNLLTSASSSIQYERKDNLTASEVEAGSIVLLVTGTSSKGLGSAGTDVAGETTRAQAFASAAEANNITLVVLHIGGESRRGTLTDPILNVVCSSADLLLVVKGGNDDGLFTTLAGSKVPLYLYSKKAKLVDPLKAIFGIA